MNSITYFAFLLPSFFLSWSNASIKTNYTPQPAFGCTSYYDTTLKLTVYTGVEKEPEYPGGAAAWARYIDRNLRTENIDASKYCNVRIKMIIDPTGEIRKVVPMRGDTEVKEPNANEKEVLRVYLKSKFWAPGICSGNNVTTEFFQSFNPCNR
ncbi:hypothetical protein [Niastella vici]|nr:hypothetical protein [Niastella vici]